jgi:phosphocarrier protein HPr
MSEPVVTSSVHIDTENGLHIRPAEALARLANKFAARIEIVYESQRVDAKSIMDMLTLGAGRGAELHIEARGDDAQQAVDAILMLVENNFESPNGAAPAPNSSPS